MYVPQWLEEEYADGMIRGQKVGETALYQQLLPGQPVGRKVRDDKRSAKHVMGLETVAKYRAKGQKQILKTESTSNLA